MPPIPQRIVSTDGQVVPPDGAIQRGQAVWQTLGGMEVGSLWGHGSYVAPDWKADWLHREFELILDDLARSEHARSYVELGPEQQAAQPGEVTSARMALSRGHRLQPCPPSERGT
jgi:nitric oxide reductase subunit B